MKDIEKELAACLDEIKAGKTIEECLEKRPDASDELTPLLRLAASVDDLPQIAPSAAFKARGRAAIVEYAHDHPRRKGWRLSWLVFATPGWVRAGAIVLAALVVLGGTGTGTAYASQSSLPGDLLYPVKTGTESLRTWAERDPAAESALQVEFAGRRVREMEQLAAITSPDVAITVSGYQANLERALAYADAAGADTPLEDMAVTIADQLGTLDGLEDSAGTATQLDIEAAEQVAVNMQIRTLRRLSQGDPLRACELAVVAMQSRLNRAAGTFAAGHAARGENALRQFVMYAGLGEEVEADYSGTAAGATIEALFQQAMQNQERLFAGFAGQVPSGLANEVNNALRKMERNRGQEPGGNQGPQQGPGQNQPVDAGQNQPTDAGQNQPTDAGQNQPTDAGQNQPVDTGQNQPADAGQSQPADSGQGTQTGGGSDAGASGSGSGSGSGVGNQSGR